jgi:glycopeptide antibiotics resistance protein
MFAVLAAAVGALLIFVAIDSKQIYSPGAGHVYRFLFVRYSILRGFETPVGFMTVDSILRKLYALAAFALVGLLSAPLFRTRRRRAAALLVTGFSLAIEILQKIGGSRESIASNVFDILSGTIGGYVGAVVFEALASLARGFRRSRSQ